MMTSRPAHYRISGSYDDAERLLETQESTETIYHYSHYPQPFNPYSPPPPRTHDAIDVTRSTTKVEGLETGGVQYGNFRRYSRVWWSKTWSAAIEVGVWPRIIYSVLGLTMIAAWISLM
jgi:hypothetical protein